MQYLDKVQINCNVLLVLDISTYNVYKCKKKQYDIYDICDINNPI
jgi:hypothetical protein